MRVLEKKTHKHALIGPAGVPPPYGLDQRGPGRMSKSTILASGRVNDSELIIELLSPAGMPAVLASTA
jgi:hypothetical protein